MLTTKMTLFGLNILVGAVLLLSRCYGSNQGTEFEANVSELNGEWILENQNKSIKVLGKVPGSVFTDLMNHGIIGDPYYRFNDNLYQWVATDNWTYTRNFLVKKQQSDSILLVCDGIDTVANISINDRQIAANLNNMFIRRVFEIKSDLINDGLNTITIRFESAITYAARMWRESSYDIPPDCTLPDHQGACHVNFIRKMPSSFGWDWGPSLPSQGIWKNISLVLFSRFWLDSSSVSVIHSKNHDMNSWMLQLTLNFHHISLKSTLFIYSLKIPKFNFVYSDSFELRPGQSTYKMNISLPKQQVEMIELWWPNGYGKQALYDLILYNGQKKVKTFKIGFRTVELIQEPIPNSSGLSFYFKINDRPIFMKGSNWIPADSFLERVTARRLRNYLQSAADAHINMLRVWGGGVYESEEFYELASEYGILIWQDMMFACAMYPTTSQFLRSVTEEIKQQIQRLSHHPAIALWSGNNENEAALADNWYGTSRNYSLFYADYVKLYVDTIRDVVTKEDASNRPFVVSSPSNGILEQTRKNWVQKNPYDEAFGDDHFYVYRGQLWDWKAYPRARFVSEYGFQSLPSFETLKKVSAREDWYYDSKFLQHRQHHANGNKQNLDVLSVNLNIPKTPNATNDFLQIIYLLQINQAMIIKTETEHYRRLQNNLMDGHGMTMGALYWQLQDIWPAPSWSSIESTGKWKMLHYYVKNFFAKQLISPFIEADGQTLNIHYIHDAFVFSSSPPMNETLYYRPLELGLKCLVTVWSLIAGKPLPGVDSFGFYKPNLASVNVRTLNLTSFLPYAGCKNEKDCFLYFTLYEWHESGRWIETAHNFLFLAPLKHAAAVAKSRVDVVDVKYSTEENTCCDITLRQTGQMALFVWIEAIAISGRFSDNGFHMVTDEMTIRFYPWIETISVFELRNALTVKWLND
ncbi:beta-mannosidase-like [Tubulanus polymorphus]|uniref:beta-mannosidase-like n=1 Tax=Tubulanus polymorphus TaxID=672921 RepID=UPI003DA2EEAB